MRLAHLAQEDSHLPATVDTLGSLTRVVHELTIRLARYQPLVLYSVHQAATDRPAEERDGIRHVRLSAEPDRTLLAAWFRWRNRIARRLGVTERPYPASSAYYWSYIRRVARHLAAERPDVVHLHNVAQFVPPLRGAAPDARLVLQMHCEWLVELPRALVARRLAEVDLVLGVSEHIVRQVRQAFPPLADRCRVLHNGVDATRFRPRRQLPATSASALAALRARLGVRGPVVLYVGRLSSEKGAHVLLEAFGAVRERLPEATCIVVGPDWGPLRRVRPAPGRDHDAGYLDRLRRLAAPHGSRVVLAGPVPNGELPLWYGIADVVAAPSLLEAFGIPAIEAGATGVPVVAAAVGGLLDTVVHGETGLLLPAGDVRALADGLVALLADPARARALGDAGRERVLARFTWDRIADRLAAYYDALVPGSARAA
jgi:glycosyltransferase involved in cell wall biosynthesis